jgi:hypothetical protein
VKVDIYHECLGGTASGDGPKFKPLDPIDIDLDVRRITFLTNSKAGKDSLEKQLKTCYAEVLKWPVKKSGIIKITSRSISIGSKGLNFGPSPLAVPPRHS